MNNASFFISALPLRQTFVSAAGMSVKGQNRTSERDADAAFAADERAFVGHREVFG